MTIDELAAEAYDVAVARGQWRTRGLRPEIGAEGPVWEEVREFTDALRAHVYERAPREHVEDELADVVIAAASTARHLGIDLEAAVRRKLERNRERARREVEQEIVDTYLDAKEPGRKSLRELGW